MAFRAGKAFAENRFSRVCDSFIIPAARRQTTSTTKNVLRSSKVCWLSSFLSLARAEQHCVRDCVDSRNLLRLGRITGSRSTKFPPKTMPTERVRRKFHTDRWSNHHYPEPATKNSLQLGLRWMSRVENPRVERVVFLVIGREPRRGREMSVNFRETSRRRLPTREVEEKGAKKSSSEESSRLQESCIRASWFHLAVIGTTTRSFVSLSPLNQLDEQIVKEGSSLLWAAHL